MDELLLALINLDLLIVVHYRVAFLRRWTHVPKFDPLIDAQHGAPRYEFVLLLQLCEYMRRLIDQRRQ